MNDQKPRLKMPERAINERTKDFEEVALGLSAEEAIAEAKRCIQCKKPLCVGGCPVEIDIPGFIKQIATGDMEAAINKLKEKNNLPAVCGRVCPQEDQCEKECILGKKGNPITIGYLERYAADHEAKKTLTVKKQSGAKVAVVGSGPAGLACAGDLARMGYQVTLFESLNEPGGVLTYGIPEFRLPKKIVKLEVEYIKSLGVDLQTDMIIGNVFTIEQLLKKYKAVFVGAGAGLPKFIDVPGESLSGVYSANEFLTRVNLMKAYKFPEHATPVHIGKAVCVVGGGNVAMDAARCALRLGADNVYIVYRRSHAELPARKEEIERAEEEGIKFLFLTAPLKLIGECREDGSDWVAGIECIKMELGEPDDSGRRRPVPVSGSEFVIGCDTVISAIGQSPNPLIPHTTKNLKTERWGGVIVDQNQMTSIPGVYSGGDLVRGAATVISAMGDGKRAAKAIDEFIKASK